MGEDLFKVMRELAASATGLSGLVLLQMLNSRASAQIGECTSGNIGGVEVVMVKSFKSEERYLVIPGLFCSCPYFTGSVLTRGADWSCKHLLRARHNNDENDMEEFVAEIYARLRA